MGKPKTATIEVQGSVITVRSEEMGDFIFLTDMVRNFEGGSALIEQWLKNKDTIIFPGVWERIYNPDFKPSNSRELEMRPAETVSSSRQKACPGGMSPEAQ